MTENEKRWKAVEASDAEVATWTDDERKEIYLRLSTEKPDDDADLEGERDRYKKALEPYAEPDNWGEE